jgi:tight adherence protein C
MDPTTLLALGMLAAFLAVSLGAWATIAGAAARRRVQRSLRAASTSGHLPDLRSEQLAIPVTHRLLLPGIGMIGRRLQRLTPTIVVDRLDRELLLAGSPEGWDGQRVMAVKVMTAVGFGIVSVVLLAAAGLGVLRTLVLVPFLTFLGYYLPEWLLRVRSGRRQHELQRALPDALDLLSITVQAGLGFDAAIERVSRQMGGPLGGELYRVTQEMRLGKSRGEALRDLADRTNVEELRSFVLAMVQAEIFGISISRVLANQATDLRLKRRQRAEEQAQKLPVKIIFPLILCIFPALLVVLLGPAAISIYQNLLS